jgi:hypothetical protein
MIFSGLDLGQAKDFPALVCVDRQPLTEPLPKRRWRYDVRHLQTWDLGTKYVAPKGQPSIAADVAKLYGTPQLAGTTLVPDFTGVGRPVVDTLRAERVRARIVPVTTTSGKLVHEDVDNRAWNVPKKDLVGVLQVLLQANLVRWSPKLPLAARLEKELSDFRVTITRARNETFGAEASQHDDLVLALMLACWLGERDGGGLASGIGVPVDGAANAVESAPAGVFAAMGGLAGNDPNRHGARR